MALGKKLFLFLLSTITLSLSVLAASAASSATCNVRSSAGSCQKHSETIEAELIDRQLEAVPDAIPDVVVQSQDDVLEPAAEEADLRSLQSWGNRPSRPEVRHVIPETFMVNNRFESLFRDSWNPVSITIETTQPRRGQILVTLVAVNTVEYDIRYNEADGWVSNVAFIRETRGRGSADNVEAERRIRDIIDRVQQIAFEADGTYQFITDFSATRVSFRRQGSTHRRNLSAGSSSSGRTGDFRQTRVEVREADSNTFMVNGQFRDLFEGDRSSTSVSIQTSVRRRGSINVRLGNSAEYDIAYQESDGWVTGIVTLKEPPRWGNGAGPAESRVLDIVSRVQQISFEPQGDYQFITDSGATRIVFRNLQQDRRREELEVVPSTFMVNGRFETLNHNTRNPIPITVSTQNARGRFNVILRAVNDIEYDIAYNEADGWVSRVDLIRETRRSGNRDDMDAEFNVKNIISSVQQIAFERDGTVQFITDFAATRVTFAPKGSVRPPGSETRHLRPETFMVDGRFENVFAGDRTIDISIRSVNSGSGRLEVTLIAANEVTFRYEYQERDGWVLHISPAIVRLTGRRDGLQAENRVRDILSRTQQITFERDGTWQFISADQRSRVSFAS